MSKDTRNENLTQEKVYLPSHPNKPGPELIYFFPEAIDEMSLEEYGLYTCIYYSNISKSITSSVIYSKSNYSKEKTDKIISSLIKKGWIVEERTNG